MSHHHHDSESNISTVFFLNLIFTIIELIGGIYTNSLAIISDSLHDLGDSISLGLAWYLQKVSKKGRSTSFTYGYKRFSLLGAVISAIVLITGSILILSRAIPGLANPANVNSSGMILLSILGIVFNGIAFVKLRKSRSIIEKMVMWHLLEDVLGWVVVLIGAIFIYLFNIPIIDPILSILIAVLVLYNVIKHLKTSLSIFLQGTPKSLKLSEIETKIKGIDGVLDTHDCHAWSMDGEYNVVTIHVVTNDEYDVIKQTGIKSEIKSLLKSYPIDHITIEMESVNDPCEFEDC